MSPPPYADLRYCLVGQEDSMEQVTGIGGVFFHSKKPADLLAWYQTCLGIEAPQGYLDYKWRHHDDPQRIGRTVWSIQPEQPPQGDVPAKAFMINYRVANLDRMLDQLRQHGVTIEKIEDYDYGRFAWIVDPDGNRIELWEPAPE